MVIEFFYCHLSSSPGNVFLGKGKNRIGSRYKKVVYREYTDESFSVKKEQQPGQQHLGILGRIFTLLSLPFCCVETAKALICVFSSVGPMIRAEVGEQIVITFKNKASRPYSITAHGVKASAAHIPNRPGEIIEAAGRFFSSRGPQH